MKKLLPVPLLLAVVLGLGTCSMGPLDPEIVSTDQQVERCLRGRRYSLVRISGRAIHFLQTMTPDYAEISILERPRRRPVIADADGNFSMWIAKRRGTTIGLSFVMKHPLYPESQTGVIAVGDQDVDDVIIQVVDTQYLHALKAGLEGALGAPGLLDLENTCQVVTTAGKVWASMWVYRFPHGEPGAVAVIDPPPVFPSLGPIYFDRHAVPDPTLTSTSEDGGIVYLNMPEGEYTITATKPGVEFTTVRVKARPGIIVVAGPPYEVKGDQE